uniref:Uncharacterized protein n=1 Tax=Graphocephala atropunctata TaxID=36148 RepID=A0A1B6M329_9HEMI
MEAELFTTVTNGSVGAGVAVTTPNVSTEATISTPMKTWNSNPAVISGVKVTAPLMTTNHGMLTGSYAATKVVNRPYNHFPVHHQATLQFNHDRDWKAGVSGQISGSNKEIEFGFGTEF